MELVRRIVDRRGDIEFFLFTHGGFLPAGKAPAKRAGQKIPRFFLEMTITI